MLTKSQCWRVFAPSTSLFDRGNAFLRDIGAVTSIEYALLGSLIAVTIAGVCGAVFSKLSTEYTEIGNIFS